MPPLNRRLKYEIIGKFDNQGQCAEALGIGAPRVSRILRGRVKPSPRDLKAFARVFGREHRINSLLRGEGENHPE